MRLCQQRTRFYALKFLRFNTFYNLSTTAKNSLACLLNIFAQITAIRCVRNCTRKHKFVNKFLFYLRVKHTIKMSCENQKKVCKMDKFSRKKNFCNKNFSFILLLQKKNFLTFLFFSSLRDTQPQHLSLWRDNRISCLTINFY